ncbi:hypothetical protein PUN28_016830 [Cardiocondyla obscurior]|uniref:Uncharacterized protein n=1 Tax=Cardiocondyla obscurior TaxID=286306 RepID=A0AAW2EQM5_9HYME
MARARSYFERLGSRDEPGCISALIKPSLRQLSAFRYTREGPENDSLSLFPSYVYLSIQASVVSRATRSPPGSLSNNVGAIYFDFLFTRKVSVYRINI